EQRTLTARAVYAFIYTVLILGSVTMVYPFLLMVGASLTSDTDYDDWRVIPAYLTDDTALFRKWMSDRYGADFAIARRIHRLEVGSFRFLEQIPDYRVHDPKVIQRVEDWLQCVKTLPDEWVRAHFIDDRRTRPTNQRYARWLIERYEGDIQRFNRQYGTVYSSFIEVAPFEVDLTHKSRRETSPLRQLYLEFRRTLPAHDLMAVLATDGFLSWVERHIGGVNELNALLGTNYRSLDEVLFPAERPRDPRWQRLWDRYVRERFPLLFVRVEGNWDAQWQRFLRERHPQRYEQFHSRFPATLPQDDLHFADWVLFVDTVVPAEAKKLVTVEGLWRDWLRQKYGTLQAVNAAHGTAWKRWEEVYPPRAETDVLTFWRHKDEIRREFLTRNYRLVLDYILFHGRALWNTFVLVLLTVLGQLTVQPLAAYGLSRFNLPYAHKILLALLATMAFPAEVAMIPNFLLIKELGLLNTYWALILPGLASGMGIFLLKGYFDSLPRELYEAAMLDGASELRMFWNITVPLAMPILAVIALGAFTSAYGGFMWAFLVVQKPEMWTMMVFLWQLGRESYPWVWMASLVIAALPTLLVFILAQKVILRGIIVPTMK
ncbi:MAG: ABC transporter permease subunit, partial [Armatimonadetes bacterium]|nr:ABC transporter permease subunit [Armatimonadota bacterium]